ncbi:MAG TPA: ATP-binding protein [Pirellulales bacterium]|nr:ATP-binding protein [Pirellulales bacterium]
MQRYAERMLRRFGPHYILLMMWVTRLSGSIGGLLVLYYVNLSLTLPDDIRLHFAIVALMGVSVAVTLTVQLAMWETRHLREVLRRIASSRFIEPKLAAAAGREAVIFAGRHHRHESWLVPATTLVPMLVFLKMADNAPPAVLINISLAAFMGTVMALMSTYFLIVSFMRPVIAYLLEHGLAIEFDSLPVSKLRGRLNICFALIILTTALMIGTLAKQRATDIVNHPESQAEAVANLRHHTTYITVVAVGIGLIFSTVLAQSVAVRVGNLVDTMKRVQAGDLSARLTPTGNDEIDIVTRQFNAMVSQLDRNDHTIRDLNANLGKKVKQRTRQLSKKKRELQSSLRQLQEHDRLKTQFFSNVSHELRTPLTMILAPLEDLLGKRGPQLPKDAAYMLDVALVNGRRLLDLINRLLEFSKLEAGHARLNVAPVDLRELVDELATSARPLAEQRQIELRVEHASALPVIGADADKMDSVVTNLLSNALKFTPPGGIVEIKSRHEGGRIYVSVRDSGIGIAPEDHARVFERFVQIDGSTARRYSGTGLGLSLVKELVELHGGEIRLDSEAGKGAMFTFWVPVTEPPSEQVRQASSMARTTRFADLVVCEPGAPAADEAPPAAPTGAPTVLVVDDTPEMRRLLAGVLSDQYTVVTAEDGEQGCALAEEIMPDLIISDVMMPVTDGYEFCRRVKQNPVMARIPFVLLTAKADRTMKIEGLEIGADDYLVKPFDAEELRARVRSLLRLRALDRKLDERNAELEKTLSALQNAQSQMLQMAHLAGMTEIATGVLHNVGNVLNNVNISTTVLSERIRQMRVDGLSKVAGLIGNHSDNLHELLGDERRRNQLMDYLNTLSAAMAADQTELLGELSFLVDKVQHIRNIIVAEQHYARRVSFKERCDVRALMEDILLMHSHSVAKFEVELIRDFDELPPVTLERSKLLQVLDNLVKNAIESMSACDTERVLTVQIKAEPNEQVRIAVKDTGSGIDPAHANRIFNFGFTTKQSGNGFGLHSSANAMSEMGGSISVHSDGVDLGATFTLLLPLVAEEEEGSTPAAIREESPMPLSSV